MKYYSVAVNYPIGNGILNYSFDQEIPIGSLVSIPLGKRQESGCVVALEHDFDPSKQKYKTKEIIAVENEFALSEKEIELYQWMSSYYHYSLGKLIFDCLPKRLKRPRLAPIIQGQNPQKIELSKDQDQIFKDINR